MLIYCIDKGYKDELVSKGLHFIKEELIDGKLVYLLVGDKNIKFESLDSTKTYTSKTIKF